MSAWHLRVHLGNVPHDKPSLVLRRMFSILVSSARLSQQIDIQNTGYLLRGISQKKIIHEKNGAYTGIRGPAVLR